jgi:hypothetical protein
MKRAPGLFPGGNCDWGVKLIIDLYVLKSFRTRGASTSAPPYAFTMISSLITKTCRLCGPVVRVPGYRSRGQGSTPDATRFFEK